MLTFDPETTAKIAAFLRGMPADKIDHAAQCFPRALNAVYQRACESGCVAAAVVAYYDDETTFRVFDTLADAIDAVIEYKSENAPCVVFSMTNVEVSDGAPD